MNQKQIRQRIRKMSLKEKAYKMTQFCPYYTFLDSDNVATGDDVSYLLPDDFNPTGSVIGMMISRLTPKKTNVLITDSDKMDPPSPSSIKSLEKLLSVQPPRAN